MGDRSNTHQPASCVQELAKEDNHELEAALGFPLFTDGEPRLGWLMNMNAVRPPAPHNLPAVWPSLQQPHVCLAEWTQGAGSWQRGSREDHRWEELLLMIAGGCLWGPDAMPEPGRGAGDPMAAHDSCCVQTTMENKESGHAVSAINCYFMCQVGALPTQCSDSCRQCMRCRQLNAFPALQVLHLRHAVSLTCRTAPCSRPRSSLRPTSTSKSR